MKRKLTSRKLWVAIANFVTMLIVFITSGDNSPERIYSLIMAGGTMVAYIVGEGFADGKGKKVEWNAS